VFVDTNVWVYAVDQADPTKRARARELTAPGSSTDIVVSSQVLSEFYVVATRKLARPLEEGDAAAMVSRLSDLPVVAVDAELVARAVAGCREWDISLWDALIVCAAETADCEVVWSEDLSDGQTYGTVTVTNPFRGTVDGPQGPGAGDQAP
jgi:predicted nucleic acid-binding protein